MQIKMLTSIAGNFVANRGAIVDRPEPEALRLIAAGLAAPVAADHAEIATAPAAPERAARRRGAR